MENFALKGNFTLTCDFSAPTLSNDIPTNFMRPLKCSSIHPSVHPLASRNGKVPARNVCAIKQRKMKKKKCCHPPVGARRELPMMMDGTSALSRLVGWLALAQRLVGWHSAVGTAGANPCTPAAAQGRSRKGPSGAGTAQMDDGWSHDAISYM